MRIELPIRIVSPNVMEHWRVRYKRNKTQCGLLTMQLRMNKEPLLLPCIVTMTRRGSKPLDDDNYRFSLKAIKDTIADHLIPGLAPGQADGSREITWVYKQEKGENALIIEIV